MEVASDHWLLATDLSVITIVPLGWWVTLVRPLYYPAISLDCEWHGVVFGMLQTKHETLRAQSSTWKNLWRTYRTASIVCPPFHRNTGSLSSKRRPLVGREPSSAQRISDYMRYYNKSSDEDMDTSGGGIDRGLLTYKLDTRATMCGVFMVSPCLVLLLVRRTSHLTSKR